MCTIGPTYLSFWCNLNYDEATCTYYIKTQRLYISKKILNSGSYEKLGRIIILAF